MAYFLGTSISEDKKITVALTQIYGIGKKGATFICKNLGLTDNIRIFELTKEQKIKLIRYIENSTLLITEDLKRSIFDFKTKLITIRSYRGIRSQQGFPVRGQRTHTNSKTSKKFKKF
jgi:small subunit ribosomal protein S13